MKKATRKYSQGIMPLGVVTIIGVKKNISHLQIIEKKYIFAFVYCSQIIRNTYFITKAIILHH